MIVFGCNKCLVVLNRKPVPVDTQFQPLGLGLLVVNIGPRADNHGQEHPDQSTIELAHRTRPFAPQQSLQDEVIILECYLLGAHG